MTESPWKMAELVTTDESTKELSPPYDHGGHKCMDDKIDNLYPKSGYPNGIPVSGFHRPKVIIAPQTFVPLRLQHEYCFEYTVL